MLHEGRNKEKRQVRAAVLAVIWRSLARGLGKHCTHLLYVLVMSFLCDPPMELHSKNTQRMHCQIVGALYQHFAHLSSHADVYSGSFDMSLCFCSVELAFINPTPRYIEAPGRNLACKYIERSFYLIFS